MFKMRLIKNFKIANKKIAYILKQNYKIGFK